jgi:hypothetical protein
MTAVVIVGRMTLHCRMHVRQADVLYFLVETTHIHTHTHARTHTAVVECVNGFEFSAIPVHTRMPATDGER